VGAGTTVAKPDVTMNDTNTRLRRRGLLALAPALLGAWLPAACVAPIEVSGGPARANHRLAPEALAPGLRGLVQDDPAALARLDDVESDASRSRLFLYSGMAALGGCLLISSSTVNGRTSSGSMGLIFGTCGLAIGLEIVSIIYAPTYSDYGDVLRVYNARHPQSPWFSPRLSVEPPALALRSPLLAAPPPARPPQLAAF
jgi:hypothetical protein